MTEYKMISVSFIELIDIMTVLATYPFIVQNNYKWSVDEIEKDESLKAILLTFTIHNLSTNINHIFHRSNNKPKSRESQDTYVIKVLPSSILEASNKWRPGLWSSAVVSIYNDYDVTKTLYLDVDETLYDVIADVGHGDVTAKSIFEYNESVDSDEDDEDTDTVAEYEFENQRSFDFIESIQDIHDRVIAYTSYWIDKFNED